MTTHRRNKHGEILCTDCGGEGEVEESIGHPNDTDAPMHAIICPRCDGSAVEECCMCGDPARIHGGIDPRFLYCTTSCAVVDDNASGLHPLFAEILATHRLGAAPVGVLPGGEVGMGSASLPGPDEDVT